MPPQHIDRSSLMKELEEHNEFFDNLVDMIPAKLYVGNNPTDETSIAGSKYQKSQSEESKAAKKSKMKVEKGNKFDPSQQESTRDLKRRLEEEQEAENSNSDEDDDDMSMNAINFPHDNHEEEEDDETDARPDKDNKEGSSASKNSAHQSRIEELRAKLRAKLEEKRNASATNSTSDAVISKRAARRAEKRRRLELAKKKQAEQQNSSAGKTLTGKNGVPNVKIVTNLGGSKINSDVKQPNFMDDLSGIDFGGIAGLKDDLLTKGRYTSFNKSLKNMGKKKNLEKLLEEAESKKERLRQLKESDNIEDKEKAKKMEWNEALKIANGEKTRDTDPKILKKAIKRKAKKKAKSQEAWKSRMEQTKEKMDERQAIRNHNIKQRSIGGMAGANLSKKRIKDAEGDEKEPGASGGEIKKRARLGPYSGKGRAGFEGKKRDFINKG
eukprot:CAMPEP_0176497150 /NCGR_PEP_ID=MMETSP0200_2-20121128/11566_1 /TAXON_ID=947934 /ORGANISM="Chaetoceros sp., Strain GSL56" /LENGTH=439 /DNA_ID=CAMNT_0017895135 /DNA_START=69 /DNA_END=1384 /DNA_ORIENTATION=-